MELPPLLACLAFQPRTRGSIKLSIENSIKKSNWKSPSDGLFFFAKECIVLEMQTQYSISLAKLPRLPLASQVSVGIIRGKCHKELTELIARFALRGYFHFIVGGEWLPDQDNLRRAIRRYTTSVNETLDHPILGRPSTCLQLRDQLTTADTQPHPIFILDFLNRFYDPDVELALRERVFHKCCQQVQVLAQTKPVFILIHWIPTEDYERFLPLLASVADEIMEVEENSQSEPQQYSLF